jgi:hypothetical protein
MPTIPDNAEPVSTFAGTRENFIGKMRSLGGVIGSRRKAETMVWVALLDRQIKGL